jgi:hypothetical protein
MPPKVLLCEIERSVDVKQDGKDSCGAGETVEVLFGSVDSTIRDIVVLDGILRIVEVLCNERGND